jgi:hypothetical protein
VPLAETIQSGTKLIILPLAKKKSNGIPLAIYNLYLS